MPSIPNVTTVRVTELFRDTSGQLQWGTVTFTPVTDRPAVPGTTLLIPSPVNARVQNGVLNVDLVASDDPDVLPGGWAYSVVEDFPGVARKTYLISVTSAMAPKVRLSSIAPLGTAPALVPIAYVTSVNGSIGAVTTARPSAVAAFTTPGSATWTKPVAAQMVEVLVFGGGGGGGSGRRGAAGTVRAGGGAGGGGGWTRALLNAADLPASCPIFVGAGGLGGSSAAVADNGNGQGGGSGGSSVFNDVTASATTVQRVRAGGGAPGAGGTNASGTGGGGGFALWGGGAGAAASTTGFNGVTGSDTAGPAGGGSGGGVTATDVATSAGAGGVNSTLDQLRAAGGTVAAGAGEAGRTTLSMGPGNGGGGGGASITGPAGVGGAGGLYGGGGGGGGASLNGNAVGAGGKGGDGAVFVITYF